MKKGVWRGMALCLALVPVLFAREAAAFFPLGGYLDTGELIYMRWPLSALDTNRDGDVRIDTEGLPMVFESGPVGFTDGEIQTVLSGFDVWEQVATSYMAFRYAGKTSDPLELETGLSEGSIDFINYVAFEFNDDLEGTRPVDDADVLPEGTLGITLISFSLTDTTVTVDGQTYPVTGGQFIDVDMVFNGDLFRNMPEEFEDIESLKGAAVTASGFALGLNISPLVNPTNEILDEDGNLIFFEEERVVSLPTPAGPATPVGVTSSMVGDIAFGYVGGGNSREDLAPDDIAGVSFLYPRGDQSNFFSITHEARTRSRRGFPSGKIEGGYVVAWCDADNDPTTPRVPFTDTLTGLYEFQELQQGYFTLYNLFKQLPNDDGVLFEPTYVLSVQPFEPYSGGDPSDYDSTHGGQFEDFGTPLEFSSLFSSEVFREGGNILDVANVEEGTPLFFSPARNRVISAESGKSLPQMLPGDQPMFGDPVGVCPLLQIVEGGGGGDGGGNGGGGNGGGLPGLKTAMVLPDALRGFRDATLMNSTVGVALVDFYYEMAPSLTAYLKSHPTAMAGARIVTDGAEWLLGHPYALLALLVPVVLCWKRIRRARRVALPLLLALGLFAGTAQAQLLPMSVDELVGLSEEIVVGTVENTESYFTEQNHIETKVTVVLDDVIKGGLGREGRVEFTVIGGRVGDIVTYSAMLPTFRVGEETVLFLKKRTDAAAKSAEAPYRVVAGVRGKKTVETDPETGEKFVRTGVRSSEPPVAFDERPEALKRPAIVEKSDSDGSRQSDPRVALEDYKAELRGVVAQEKAAAPNK